MVLFQQKRNNKFSPFSRDPIFSWANSVTGLIDIKFSGDAKKLATSSMDSQLKVWDIETSTFKNIIEQFVNIQVPVLSSWKLAFADDNLVTCGDQGLIQFYDLSTKQVAKKLQGGDVFFTSIAVSNGDGFLAAGNNNGDLYITNLQTKDKNKKDKMFAFKPHHRIIRSVAFSEDSSKILTGSDDSTFKIFDVVSENVISSYDGHKQSVSCVRGHPTDTKVAFTCSFDKSIKIWDLRMKSCVDTFQSGSALWAIQVIGRNVVAGGENGVLSIFSIE